MISILTKIEIVKKVLEIVRMYSKAFKREPIKDFA